MYDFLEIIYGSYKKIQSLKTVYFSFSFDFEKISWKSYKVVYDK